MRVSVTLALSSLLVFASTAAAFAQNQLPLNFRGLTWLELGPNEHGGAQDDLLAQRSHRGHTAADVLPGLSAMALLRTRSRTFPAIQK
jgi:hypothetical protein